MPTTSPYSPNDYQAASAFRPYQLPVNDIMRAFTAQNNFWDEGASKVKATYQKGLELNLVTDVQKQRRDLFLKDSEKQLLKLSSMNLADPSVVRQGMNVFKPLFSDEDIIGEDNVVSSLDKELGNADTSRTKEGGKNFNPFSAENIQYEKSLLAGKLNDQKGWKSLYGNTSKYTQYQDVSKEMNTISEMVKEQTIADAIVRGENPMYIDKLKTEKVSKERLLSAINEMGSPQLKEQMRIEGRNTYYKLLQNDETGQVANKYFQDIVTNVYTEGKNDLNRNKALMLYDKSINSKPELNKMYDEQLEQLEKQLVDLDKNMREQLKNYSNLGDIKNLSSNNSKVESLWQTYSSMKIASTLAYNNVEKDIEENRGYYLQKKLELEALKAENDAKSSKDNPNLDPLSAAANGATTNPVDPAQEDKGQKIQEVKKYLEENRTYQLQKMASFTFLGDDAIKGLMANEQDPRPIGVNGALTAAEISKAAKFLNAERNIRISKGELKGNPVTDEKYEEVVKNTDVNTLMKSMAGILIGNTEFTKDYAIKTLGETDGSKLVTKLLTNVSDVQREHMNISHQVFEKQPDALGKFANYFSNKGKVLITDKEIRNAFTNLRPEDLIAYSVTYTDDRNQQHIKQFSNQQEAEQYIKDNKNTYLDYRLKMDEYILPEFKKHINNLLAPVYLNAMAARANTETETFLVEKGNEATAIAGLENLAIKNTDNNQNVETTLAYLNANVSNVAGYRVFSPGVGEDLPYVKPILRSVKDDDKVGQLAINTKIPITVAGQAKLAKFAQKPSKIKHINFPDAVISYYQSSNPPATIKITNQGRDSEIKPLLEIKGGEIYRVVKNPEGKYVKGTPYTPKDFEKRLLERFNASSLEQLVKEKYETGELNEAFTAMLLDLENSNKNLK